MSDGLRCFELPVGGLTRRRLLSLLGGSLASLGFPNLRRAWAASLPQSAQAEQAAPAPIKFSLQSLPFKVETDETPQTPHAPATMAGGVAVFDYNKDGRPDIFLPTAQTLKR